MKTISVIGMLMLGFLYGIVVDVVAYNLIENIACNSAHPNTCLNTTAQELLAKGIIMPIAYSITFPTLLIQSSLQKAAIWFLLVTAILLMLGMFVSSFM